MNQHVNCLIISAKVDKDAESHLLCSNAWVNSQGTAEDVPYGNICLTLCGDGHLWYESAATMGNNGNHLQGSF